MSSRPSQAHRERTPARDLRTALFRTTRIWLKSVFAGGLDLASEVDVFRREVEDIVVALQVGDLHSAALIQRAHISMSFEPRCA